jgi:hypothetical protein
MTRKIKNLNMKVDEKDRKKADIKRKRYKKTDG